ncbi:MAG: ComEC/Rec2 family competence protein, partial [Paenibacillaceae bacterium]
RNGNEAATNDDDKDNNKEKVHSIDVLKVAHHGSKTSTTESWLNLWDPKVAVISVGERNMYRHPSPIVIDRLHQHYVSILRTDLHGEVQMKVGETGVEWRTYLGGE